MGERLACLAIGYVLGSVLSADVVARACGRGSIFELGNGNPGMANVARSLGAGPALACLVGDVGKVVAAALACRALFPALGWPVAAGWAGIGATLGHDFPAWHGLRGGKGVATLSATFFLVSWRATLVAMAAVAVTLVASGYLSVAAVVGALVFALVMTVAVPGEVALVAWVMLALALAGQWTNLWGIRDGSATRDLPRR